MAKRADLVLVAGYAEAPKGSGLREQQGAVSVVLVIERTSAIVLDADVTFISGLAARFVQAALVGRNSLDDDQEILDYLESVLFIPSKGAVIRALRGALSKAQAALGETE